MDNLLNGSEMDAVVRTTSSIQASEHVPRGAPLQNEWRLMIYPIEAGRRRKCQIIFTRRSNDTTHTDAILCVSKEVFLSDTDECNKKCHRLECNRSNGTTSYGLKSFRCYLPRRLDSRQMVPFVSEQMRVTDDK